MLDDGDEGARVGLWVAVGGVALLLFGLLGGLAIRQAHKAVPVKAAAALAAPIAMHEVAPPVARETLLQGPISGDLLATLNFAVDSAELPADAAAKLAAVQGQLAQAALSDSLVLSGFHDASGDPIINASLAKRRARAARDALVAAGVDPKRVALRKPESTTGGGPPEEARRVEVRLVH